MEAKITILEKRLAEEVATNKSLVAASTRKDGFLRQRDEEIDRLTYLYHWV
jgi:hypothetical protein